MSAFTSLVEVLADHPSLICPEEEWLGFAQPREAHQERK